MKKTVTPKNIYAGFSKPGVHLFNLASNEAVVSNRLTEKETPTRHQTQRKPLNNALEETYLYLPHHLRNSSVKFEKLYISPPDDSAALSD